jgi:hypothetical protein
MKVMLLFYQMLDAKQKRGLWKRTPGSYNASIEDGCGQAQWIMSGETVPSPNSPKTI